MEGMRKLKIGELNHGAVEELFQRDLKEVMDNIDDPSTAPGAERKIIIELSFKANNDRNMATLDVQSKTKLAPARSTSSAIIMRSNGKGLEPWEHEHYQPMLDFENVSKIDDKKGTSDA